MNVTAPMAGSVWKICVSVGDVVKEGEEVIVLESMKMEIPITVEKGGTIEKIVVSEGDLVKDGDILIKIR